MLLPTVVGNLLLIPHLFSNNEIGILSFFQPHQFGKDQNICFTNAKLWNIYLFRVSNYDTFCLNPKFFGSANPFFLLLKFWRSGMLCVCEGQLTSNDWPDTWLRCDGATCGAHPDQCGGGSAQGGAAEGHARTVADHGAVGGRLQHQHRTLPTLPANAHNPHSCEGERNKS